MTEQEAVNNLSLAVAAAVQGSAGVAAAVKDFAQAGFNVLALYVGIEMDIQQIPTHAAEATDDDFLRKMRIQPDLTVSERKQ